MTEENHAIQNAKGWTETIAELVAALNCDYDRLEELRDERESLVDDVDTADEFNEDGTPNKERTDAQTALALWDQENAEELAELTAAASIDGTPCTDADAARERIEESPLSVQVRDGWRSPGDNLTGAEEFEILLSTGGPALRIRGELDQGQPSRAWLEYQDWGTPWTQYFEVEQDTLLAFCQVFYFGE